MPGTDGVTAVRPRGGRGEIEFRLIIGMDPIKRLALLDAIADLAEQPDAGALVDRRAGGPSQAVELKAIDLGNRTVGVGGDVEGQSTDVVTAVRGALCVDDTLHCFQRRTAVEQFAGTRIAGAATQ